MRRVDALVVGSGPGGSIAATVLARGGARVALVDKVSFPRDKACGDLVGPRGLQVLAQLGIALPPGPEVGDMEVVGPSGRRVRLPSADGLTYPGHGTVVTRLVFDALLHETATRAGAEARTTRVEGLVRRDDGRVDGVRLAGGEVVHADVVIGADGATSTVAAAAGLVRPAEVLWGFAVRCYADQPVALPVLALFDVSPGRGFPGYGWLFPGPDGRANLGLGIAAGADRQAGSGAVRHLAQFVDHLVALGLLEASAARGTGRRLGGWLKMGLVGTNPASGPVLLVGDAAGLVNPFQGEGIAQAMTSGHHAAAAVLADPGGAAARYRAALARAHLPFVPIAATTHRAVAGHPRAVSLVGRALTAPGVGRALAGGWAVFWNELLDGAPPGRDRTAAAVVSTLGRWLTAPSATARRLREVLGPTGDEPAAAERDRAASSR